MAKFYESRKQGYCPKCGNEIEFDNSFIDGDELIYYFTCDCGLAGSEYYKLNYLTTLGDDATLEELENGCDIVDSE